MSLTSWLLGGRQQQRAAQFAESWPRHGGRSLAGVPVSEEGALRNMAVFACVRLVSQSLASMPLILYERRGRQRLRAVDHPVYRVLHDLANSEMTAFELREARLAAAMLWGNAYAEIEYDDQWNVRGLWPMAPGSVGVERNEAGDLQYTYYSQSQGRGFVLPGYRVQHLRYLIVRGAVGISPIRQAMNAVGLGQAMEEFGSKYFANGSRPSVVIKHPAVLKPDAYERLRSSFEAQWSGLDNAHRVNILEEGAALETIGIPPEEAQFLQSRKFQVAEIARLYSVPLDMLADGDAATYASVEQHNMNLRTYTLAPWSTRDAQALQRDLLTEDEQRRFYIEYLFDGLERADISTRTQAYNAMRQIGVMSANEIRERENMNPIAGGDSYWQPLNIVETNDAGHVIEVRAAKSDTVSPLALSAATADAAPTTARTGERRAATDDEIADLLKRRQRVFQQYMPLFEDAAGRLVKREIADLRRAAKKHLGTRAADDFRTYLDTFYAELRTVAPSLFEAVLQALAERMAGEVADEIDRDDPGYTAEMAEFVAGYLNTFAGEYVAASQRQLVAVLDQAAADGADPLEAINGRLDGWEESKATKTGRQQAFEAGNALGLALYVALGVQRKRWAARGDSCPFCQRMNGRVVGVKDHFVAGGEHVHGEDGAEPMLVRRPKGHGPLHGDCDCVVIAA